MFTPIFFFRPPPYTRLCRQPPTPSQIFFFLADILDFTDVKNDYRITAVWVYFYSVIT